MTRKPKGGGRFAFQSRTVALLTLIGMVSLSILKGYLGIDSASTVLIATISGAVVGYYFGAERDA